MRIQKRGVDLDLDWNPELEETDELDLREIPGGWGVNEAVWTPEMGLLPRFCKEDGMMGYWDLHNDRWGIEPRFKRGTLFHYGLAAVCLEDERWFFIDYEGNWLEHLGYSEIQPRFSEGERRIVVSRNREGTIFSRDGIIDYDGREIYPCRCYWIDEYENGICRSEIYHEDENEIFFIDLYGHELSYSVQDNRPDGYAVIESNNQIYILTPERQLIAYPHTLNTSSSYLGPGLFKIQDEEGHVGAADVAGNIIIPTMYLRIEKTGDNGWFPVTSEEGAFYVDRDNNPHLDLGFKNTKSFNCYGFAVASDNEGKYAIIDSDGDFLFPPSFSLIYEIEPMLWIGINFNDLLTGRYEDDMDAIIGPGLVDRKLEFNKIGSRKEGLFYVFKLEGDKSGHDVRMSNHGFINRYGEVIIKLPDDCVHCYDFDEGLAKIFYSADMMQDYGYMDHWGTIVKWN